MLEHDPVVILGNTQQMGKAVAATTALVAQSPSLESQPNLADLQGMPGENNGHGCADDTKESNRCTKPSSSTQRWLRW